MYRQHLLPEGALVAEICNLIHAGLPKDEILLCERRYKTLLPPGAPLRRLRAGDRADLTIATSAAKTSTASKNIAGSVRSIIEVKRASAGWTAIIKDLVRLWEARSLNKRVRAYLFVIAEERRPRKLVDDKGKSRLGKQPIPGTSGHFRVRRTCKAAKSYSRRDTAHYACLLEVFL